LQLEGGGHSKPIWAAQGDPCRPHSHSPPHCNNPKPQPSHPTNTNPNPNPTQQAIGLLDDLDKELNTYAMRVREWYGWHFPEMTKIVSDNIAYAKAVSGGGWGHLVGSVLDGVLSGGCGSGCGWLSWCRRTHCVLENEKVPVRVPAQQQTLSLLCNPQPQASPPPLIAAPPPPAAPRRPLCPDQADGHS